MRTLILHFLFISFFGGKIAFFFFLFFLKLVAQLEMVKRTLWFVYEHLNYVHVCVFRGGKNGMIT